MKVRLIVFLICAAALLLVGLTTGAQIYYALSLMMFGVAVLSLVTKVSS